MNRQGAIPNSSSAILVLLVLLSLVAACSSDSGTPHKPTAEGGIIDISNWDFESDGILALDGEWEIFPNEFLSPSDFRSPDSILTKEFIEIPGMWNMNVSGEGPRGCGYATLRLNVKTGGQKADYQIRIIQVTSAYQVWINGELAASEGRIGTSADQASPAFGLKEILLPDHSEDIEIIIKISNFNYYKGGISRSVQIGNPEQITRYGKTKMGYDLIVITIVLILALGVLWLYFYQPKDPSPLYFALACIFSVTQFITENELPVLFFFEGMPFELYCKIRFLSHYLRIAFFVAFFRKIFPLEISRLFSRGVIIWATVFCIIMLFSRLLFYSRTLIQLKIVAGIVLVYLVYGITVALIKHRRGATISAIGIFALLLAGLNDILYSELIIHTRYIFSFGLIIFMFAHSFLVSKRFEKLYNSVVRLSRRLTSLDKIKIAFIKSYSKHNLETPFNAILHSASAEKGFIYVREDSGWELKVFLSFNESETMVPSPRIKDLSGPENDPSAFPYLLIRLAIEEKRNIATTNAVEEERFRNDPYIQDFDVKSTFCMRLESQNTLIGILYLENPHVENAFDNEILEMLELLSPQLTDMLDNVEIFRQLEMLNRNLEQKVKERTSELVRQKENLEIANQTVNDSINYAKYIQDSILLPEDEIRQLFPDLFIYNQPKEAVSGDFYWFSNVKDIFVIAAIDCTGHGIPGAFMSMIGNALLGDIVNGMNILIPSQILTYLNRGIKKLLRQDSSEAHAQDGMDMAICTIDPDHRILQFCGAKNPLYLVRDSKLEVIKADPWSIGGRIKRYGKDKEVKFNNHTLHLDEPVSAYMFTDGFLDQFGGEQEEKFNIDRFQEMLVKNSAKPMKEQKEILAHTMDNWKEDRKQLDDMLVIGMKV